MIKIERIETYGWEAAIRGMRNPKNSWSKMDSHYGCANGGHCMECKSPCLAAFKYYIIGPNDLMLMHALCKAGSDHRKFLRMITVTMDITAPLYWWKEFDTYKVGTVANSCSTMHKIAAKKFDINDFSYEHLKPLALEHMHKTVDMLNMYRDYFLETKNNDDWWQLIQLLPTSYNQKRTVLLNYEVLCNMYHARKHHKLDEWHTFCDAVEQLPYADLITGGSAHEEKEPAHA